jgi:hypothetical protein
MKSKLPEILEEALKSFHDDTIAKTEKIFMPITAIANYCCRLHQSRWMWHVSLLMNVFMVVC